MVEDELSVARSQSQINLLAHPKTHDDDESGRKFSLPEAFKCWTSAGPQQHLSSTSALIWVSDIPQTCHDWMNSFLLNRQIGTIAPQALAEAQNERLVKSLRAANQVSFASSRLPSDRPSQARGADNGSQNHTRSLAHAAGVSSICVDRFEGRYLLSGGADSSVAIWDFEAAVDHDAVTHSPLSHSANTSVTASLGITHISFYPFDSLAFLTSGYDNHLKLFSSDSLKLSAKFDLDSTVYSHATSNIASHLLVACATQHPTVRLVDLRSGASTHALAGHSGHVLTVAWHPRNENILASGGSDGNVRLWDIRKSASSLGVLDIDDSIGIAGYDGKGTGARRRERGRAHIGVVNGIVWTEDGHYLVSTGTDERMRVWDMVAGANTLANFGPAIKNDRRTVLLPILVPSRLTNAASEIVVYPGLSEILTFDMHHGDLVQRLRVVSAPRDDSSVTTGVRNLKSRVTSLAWRAHHVELYSAHSDGSIRCWTPRTWEDNSIEDDNSSELVAEAESKKRKRDELEDIVRSLTQPRVTFN